MLYSKKIFIVIFFVFFILFNLYVDYGNCNIANELQNKYNKIHSLSTNYIQKLKNHVSHEITIRKGNIFVLKDKNNIKIRWDTIYPETEYLFINGNLVIDYLPSDNIAYKYHLKDVADSRAILNLISGKINISQEFSITEESKENGDITRYKLIPHNPEPNMVLVYIWVNNKTKLISRIKIIDFFGNTNTISFKDIKINIPLGRDIFIFSPKKDTTLLEGTPGE